MYGYKTLVLNDYFLVFYKLIFEYKFYIASCLELLAFSFKAAKVEQYMLQLHVLVALITLRHEIRV